jgi:2-iminobutanoate/2-iminopropanoate deaminase
MNTNKRCFLSEKGPRPGGPYSSAVISHGFVFLSGMGPTDPVTNKNLLGGVQEEMPQVMANIATVLGELNLDFSDVVKTNIYLTDINDFATANEIYKSYFASDYPARTTVQVAKLPTGIHVEVEMVAACREE